jgi:hypothetical protein
MSIPRFFVLVLVLVLALAVVGCGEDPGDSASHEASHESASATASTPDGKLSANNATVEELEAAFAAAGISNPGAWAHDVEHHRPFPADDTDFSRLRRGLAEHNAAPDVVETIIAQLKLP